MNKTFYNHTSAVFFPTAVYPDRYRNIKQYRTNLEQGYSVNNILALEKIPDHKVNNFSTNYITQPTLLSDITDITSFNSDIQTAITRLSFGQPGEADRDHLFLYIYNTAGLDPDNGAPITNVTLNKIQRAVGLVSGIEGSFNNNFFFELDIISSEILRVRHTADTGVYYLTWDPISGKFLFLLEKAADRNQTSTETNNVFRYTIDEQGRLFLLKCYQGKSLIASNVNGTLSATVVPTTGLTPGVNNIFNIDLNFEVIKHQQNLDFISYKTRALNTLSVNSERSLFDQDGQYIFHTEYNDQDINSNQIKFNFFTLDTNRSEYGFIKRGTNMVDAEDTTPTFNYRQYNTLDTGLDQEQGNDKMSLTYTFYDKDIFIKNGTTTAFNAPPSIYPFEKLNINDTTFIKNGALSGPTPGLSDRVYIKRQDSSQYTNGRFLCTWLSAGSFEEPGVWVDRYYYPDVISKREAIYGLEQFSPSFDDSVDTLNRVDSSTSGRTKISTRKFFDKKSDAAITPGILIRYDRLGNQDMEDIIASSSPVVSSFDSCYTSKPLRITQDNRYLGITENLCKANQTNKLSFDGTFYTRVSAYEQINKTKAFTVSFETYIDSNVQYGYNILGNNTNMGFGVFQDMTVTPFLHVALGATLHIYNTANILLNSVTFDTPIRDVFKLSALEDFIVICEGGNIYQVDAKGNKLQHVIREELLETYISSFMEENDIYFLYKGTTIGTHIIKKLKIQNAINPSFSTADENNFDAYKQLFNVEVINSDEIEEFNSYRNTNVDYNEGILRYDNKTYIYPAYGKVQAWETSDIVFYAVRTTSKDAAGDTESTYSIVKHNLRQQPEIFTTLPKNEAITDIAIQHNTEEENVIAVVSANKIRKYTTTGQLRDLSDYDTYAVEAEEGDANPIYPLAGGEILSIDYINEYVTGGSQNGEFVVTFKDGDGNIRVSQETRVTPETLSDPVPNTGGFTYINITNFNTLRRIYNNNTLDFRLTLKNSLDRRDTTTHIISYDSSQVDTGLHTFTFSFDSIQGNITLYVDGILYANRTVPPGKYDLHDIFNGEIFIGTTGFVNDNDLSTYLKQPGYYYIKGLDIENFFIYDHAASKTLLTALALRDRRIDELVLSLPHGQRNNKATIERFYKFGNNNSSNNIDIVVNNFGIVDKELLSQIKLNILEDAESILPTGVKINNIKFSR